MSSSNLKSSRKYAVHPPTSVPLSPSPLSRDSTAVMPLRLKKKDSFSTANHTHGLGGEAKDAMLRNSGIRMRRTTSSLRVIATKGNAVLSAAISHKVFVPELELFLRHYARKEDQFAECIESAMCPFQFISHDSDDIVPSFQRKTSTTDVKEAVDNSKMEEWIKEMRLKVHMRLVQRQVTNVTTPTEGLMVDDKKAPEEGRDKKKGGSETDRKRSHDNDKKGSETSRKKGGSESDRKKQESDRKKQESDRKKRGGHSYDTLDPTPVVPRNLSDKKLAERKAQESHANKKSAFPPGATDPRKTLWGNKGGSGGGAGGGGNSGGGGGGSNAPATRSVTAQNVSASTTLPINYGNGGSGGGGGGGNNPQAPYAFDISGNAPLFQSRKNPSLTRRTHSAYDVRRVRLKARNSVGMEPVW